ncbi:hypothetical protein BDQ12DRAFT_682197 [Crucibulum laeve]|uniref:Uncharacterized protein n=1 Tax=Crucibulum laeve TaxID=68775 RepID=A0A5C3M1N1_9AGAR|nr:hypothetical protein BDQ12DRAFT_682197 [Crucibulum laeve]
MLVITQHRDYSAPTHTYATFFLASAVAFLANTDTDLAHETTPGLATYSGWILAERCVCSTLGRALASLPSLPKHPAIQEDSV